MDVLRDGIETDLEEFKVPGASWAVFGDGEIYQTGTAGLVEAGESAAVAPDTLFQAASISKPVAVLAMLRLVDRGLLDLDEDVNRKLTSWQVPPTGYWQPVVTLRQLASHSAGLTVHGSLDIAMTMRCRQQCRSSTACARRTPSASGSI